MQGTAKLWWEPAASCYRMSTPYNASFVALLKQILPANERDWDPATRIWSFSEALITPLEPLLRKSFTNVIIITRKQVEAAQAQAQSASADAGNLRSNGTSLTLKSGTRDYLLLKFAKLLPEAALKRAYLVAVTELHPDKIASHASRDGIAISAEQIHEVQAKLTRSVAELNEVWSLLRNKLE